MKYLLFGTGDYYDRYKKWFSREDVLALLDNSPSKQGTFLNGIPVLSPEEGITLPFDVIVILSFYVREMKLQLEKLGVSSDKIVHFFDLHWLMDLSSQRKSIQYYDGAREIIDSENRAGKKVLLLSHDLNEGGPAIALYHAARILRKNGYEAAYGSMLDGPLRDRLLAEKIPVVVDSNLQLETMREAEWTGSFSLILCNTISYYVFLSKRNPGIPVIWWLHDSAFFYDGVNRQILQELDRRNLQMVSVGPVPRDAFCRIVSDLPFQRLLYGVEDTGKGKRETEKGHIPLCFVTIGYMEWRKGQDLLLQAVRNLPRELRDRAEFCLVGQDCSAMAQRLRKEAEAMPEIRILGPVERERIDEILEQADLLICPSREDPMPTVAAEAMMHGVPCLVSNATGTAAYLRDGTDGLIFQSENVDELSEKIAWCILHRGKLAEMGACARKVYDTYFSMEVFERNLLSVVEDALRTEGL